MAESIIPTGGVEEAKQFIRRTQYYIEERTAELNETIRRIRDRAERNERREIDRAYAEIEPLRREMEAMIQCVATIASLEMPPATLRFIDK